MSTATRWASWIDRGRRSTPAIPVGVGTPAGVPILTQQFGQQLWLSVQIAWGASPTSPMSGWTWTDVTGDVQYQQKVAITVGRSDESTTPQPANLALTLDNRTGAYSYGPKSSNYPNVTKNVPVRVVVSYQGVPYTRFLGYSTGFDPSWDVTGRYSVVALTAAGVKRRLGKGDVPVKSVLARSIPALSGLVEYWPMEDGSNATQLAPGIPGGSPMQLRNGIAAGVASLASNSAIVSSLPLPTLATGALFGPVSPTQTAGGVLQIRFLAVWPDATNQAADFAEVLSIQTAGSSIAFWWLLYRTGGSLQLQGHDSSGAVVYQSGVIYFGCLGRQQLVSVSFQQSGPDIQAQIETYTLNAPSAGFANLTVTGQTLNPCGFITFAPNGDNPNLAVGHCTVSNQYFDIFNLLQQVNGYRGEYTSIRMSRLASENGEFLDRLGGATQLMGPQSPDTFLNLVEGCSAVDNGYLYDGFAQGLSWIPQDRRSSLPASMVLDASLGQIAHPLHPVDDDQTVVNSYTAARTNGSSATYSDTTSTLGTSAIGTYPSSTAQNFFSDAQQITDYAAWMVHVGTTPGYRWPQVEMWFHRNPELLPTWIVTRLQSRIDLVNLSTVRPEIYAAPVSLMLEGYTEKIDQFTWTTTANTTPYEPWRVGEVAAEAGDTSEYALRLETDGASVVAGVPAGSTSISVASTGVLWTTLADDMPFWASIGGQRVLVTAVSGVASPQTFTLDPTTVVLPIPVGAAVSLWQAPVLDVLAM